MITKNLKNNSGFSLIEIIIYIALFTMITLAVISSLIVMTRSFRETIVYTKLMESHSILERISREIKQSYNSTSGSSTNLKLDSIDDFGLNKIVEFSLLGNNIQFSENNSTVGNLNSPNIIVNSLIFTEILTTEVKAVKIELSVRYDKDQQNRIEYFYDTVVLRGDYGN